MGLPLTLCVCLLVCVVGSLAKLNPFETSYITLPNRTKAREYLLYYTSAPHIAGSPEDYATAVYTRDKFVEFGLTAEIVTHQILVNYPLGRVVQLVNESGDAIFTANLTEPAVSLDPTSNDTRSVPTFNGYSATGNVTGRLVYANYGRLEDFQYLKDSGINVSGTVVIVRYGAVFRGVKAMLAQKFGALGLLIYSDPIDDGYVKAGGVNNTYPTGPWRPELGVQRGSIQYLPVCPGNPVQARVGLCLGADRANESYLGNLIPNIPVQPLSWGDAYPLLQGLTGTAAPAKWQGGLNFTYNIGPGGSIVNLALLMNYTTVTIWNVIATLPGVRSDEIVLIGNHRDAWVFGATDPNSGSSVMLEVARSLALLRNTTTWVPQRDIVFCSWDAEEYGLVGSTTWGEENADYLRRHAIAYVNTDVGVAGPYFGAGGTPSLNKLIQDLTSDFPDPSNPNITINQEWNSSQLDVLGSGSDYTVFIDNLGIPCLDIEYGGNSGGVYHSIYDSFYWMEQFGDPQFLYHEALAQFLGVALMRISDSRAHPLNYTNYAAQLAIYSQNAQIIAPPTSLNFTALDSAIHQFALAGAATDAQAACVKSNSSCVAGLNVNALNARLRYTERRLLINAQTNSSDGLPGRPWYKHVVQAPGFYQGYGSQTFPGIMQAILDINYPLAQQQIARAANSISNAALALTELSVTPFSNPAKCFGDSLGNITLVANGGFTPLSYSINLTQWQNGAIFSALPAGTYLVSVLDSLNFTANATVVISQPAALQLTLVVSGSTAKVKATGGTGTYNYWWSTNDTTSEISMVSEGHYSVTVTDSNGCNTTSSLTYHPAKPKEGGISGGGVAGIVIAVLVVVAGVVGGVYYLHGQNRKKEYEYL